MNIALSADLLTVLELLTQGLTDAEIADNMGYSVKWVEKRVRTLKNLYKTERRVVLAVEHFAEKIAEEER